MCEVCTHRAFFGKERSAYEEAASGRCNGSSVSAAGVCAACLCTHWSAPTSRRASRTASAPWMGLGRRLSSLERRALRLGTGTLGPPAPRRLGLGAWPLGSRSRRLLLDSRALGTRLALRALQQGQSTLVALWLFVLR